MMALGLSALALMTLAIIAAAADVVRGLPVGVVDCAIEADEIIGDLAMVWHVELGGKHGGDPREAIAMWERAVVAATTPGRRTAAVHDRAILLWAQAQRGGTAEWIDAAEAMQSPDAGTVADAAIDAWDNAIRAARGARLDPALAARARAGLGKINSDRARILLASVR